MSDLADILVDQGIQSQIRLALRHRESFKAVVELPERIRGLLDELDRVTTEKPPP